VYVGYVNGCERLGIPALKLNDGPQGFRDETNPGTTTSFPSGLSLGASWDRDMCFAWGEAMGKEFYGKGTNVQLGPGMNLARVPLNGRNFEYMSGGDSYLGYTLVQPAIKGIQSQGIIANAKHWVHNNQETDRDDMSANVDERTQYELYYQPFIGAVEADVGSFMCSYNKIHDVYACENPVTLNEDLKDTIGFKGWVMSDWGATHSTSINEGLDQEMPSSDFFGESLLAHISDGSVTTATVNAAVMRVLTPMFSVGLFDYNNTAPLSTDVTSPEHNELSRSLAAHTHVLLKNKDDVLPLPLKSPSVDKKFKIALFGTSARAPITGGGGSGAVFPEHVVTPYQGLLDALGITDPNPQTYSCAESSNSLQQDVAIKQWGCVSVPATSVEECCEACGKYTLCQAFTYQDERCGLFPTDAQKQPSPGAVSSTCQKTTPAAAWNCNADTNMCVAVMDGLDLDAAKALAAEADVAIVAIGAFGKEGSDRQDLSFGTTTGGDCQVAGENQDEMIPVIAAEVRTIVALTAPGAVLTPWRDDVNAILHGFFPGQEYGSALADVLFGAVNPSARLPMTMPNVENEVGFKRSEYPGVKKEAAYSEEMMIDYRWYTEHGIEPAFAFGHGLSYTSFSYSNLAISGRVVTAEVQNVGKMDGREVAQLYLEFPAAANTPPLQLKGFVKTGTLTSEQMETVTFDLRDRDISVWDVASHAWKVTPGTYKVFVGASSKDVRLTGEFTV
jgi:beta-glucosidase